MIRLRRLGPLLALAVAVALSTGLLQGQSSTEDRVKRLGGQMVCMCGCGQVLTECNHIDCPLSVPMLKQLKQRVASGDSDDLILQSFVQQYGEKVLAEPPTHGFNALAWAIPGMAFVLGLALVVVVIRSWRRRPTPAPVVNRAVSAEMLERAHREIDRQTKD